MSETRILNRIRRPEYTGDNRCIPCTIVNLAIAVVISALIAVASIPAAVTALFLFLGVIALRGYLVPGTPTLTERYFPEYVLRWFDKHSNGTETRGSEGGVDEEAIETLFETGVLHECETEDDLCLSSSFRDEWRERVQTIRANDALETPLANALGVDPDDIDVSEKQNVYFAASDGGPVGRWYSRAALVSDIAAARTLESQLDEWSDVTGGTRGDVFASLRLFLRRCPSCDGPVAVNETSGERAAEESCCFSKTVLEVRCEDCDAVVLQSNAMH